jgi:hypothetical protein
MATTTGSGREANRCPTKRPTSSGVTFWPVKSSGSRCTAMLSDQRRKSPIAPSGGRSATRTRHAFAYSRRPCHRARSRYDRRVCLSELHVTPHLVIGDMAAGQWADPLDEKIPPHSRSVAITRPSAPLNGASGRFSCGSRLRSGYIRPSAQSAENSLILIDGLSHLDCRAVIDHDGGNPLAIRHRRARCSVTTSGAGSGSSKPWRAT